MHHLRTHAPSARTGIAGAGARAWVLGRAMALLASVMLAGAAAAVPTPAGTIISSTAHVDMTVGASTLSIPSNTDIIVTTELNSSLATIRFMQYAPGHPSAVAQTAAPTLYDTGAGYALLADPVTIVGTPIDADAPVPLLSTNVYHATAPIFVQVDDPDHDLNAAALDTLLITLTVAATGDSETLQFTETGPNTGLFTGFIQSTALASVDDDGVLAVAPNSAIVATYTDFTSLTATAAALVDPVFRVFDSQVGALLDGVTVTLIDNATGLPATVFGDDGVSTFPATIVTGSTVTDGGGASYSFGPGEFRFPIVPPSNYHFAIGAFGGYSFPSTATVTATGFNVVNGSRGEAFAALLSGPAGQIDIPLDPQGTVGLSFPLQKQAAVGEAAVGDIVGWTIQYANPDPLVTFGPAELVDTLPQGFRFRAGSARLDGATVPDPTISPDGTTLTFPIPLNAAAAHSLSYASDVLPNARVGVNVNSVALVINGVPEPLPALAPVNIVEELFGSRGTILGEVLVDSCLDSDGTGVGLEGVRVLMEDGTYAITDARGRFHFRGISEGTHVVQLDKASLPEGYEVELCHGDTRHAGTAFSQFVDMHRGALWRADFRIKRMARAHSLVHAKLKATSIAAQPDVALFEFDFDGGKVPLTNVRASFILPEGAKLVPTSVVLDGNAIPGAAVEDGVMNLRLGDRPAEFAHKLAFRLQLPLDETSEITGMLVVDGPTKKSLRVAPVKVQLHPIAAKVDLVAGSVLFAPHFETRGYALTNKDKADLRKLVDTVRGQESIRFQVVGFTDARKIVVHPKDPLKDNQQLSMLRADAVADFLAKDAGIDRKRILVEGRGEREPVGDNKRADGRALNRRVIISMIGASEDAAAGSSYESPTEELEVEGLRPGEQALAPTVAAGSAAAVPAAATESNYAPYASTVDAGFVAALAPGRQILWPAADTNPPVPSVKLAVQAHKGETIELSLNGRPVPKTSLHDNVSATDADVTVMQWAGVDLEDGANEFVATVRDASGVPVATLARTVHYSGRAARAELVLERSMLIADGKTKPVIAVRFLDRSGKPVHEGTAGEFTVGPPFRVWRDIDDRYTDALFALGDPRSTWRAGPDGVALIELAPTTDSGELRMNFRFGPRLEQDLNAWVEASARDWVLVGLAEGKLGNNKVDGNVQAFEGVGGTPDYYQDGRIAFYAKGMVKGSWLLTASYDTSKSSQAGGTVLSQDIDPNAYYLLYGDASEQRNDAASIRNLYLRIERKQFYAMFGDFETGLTLTELGRYTRRMNGLKSEYRGERVSYNAFATEDTTAFVKDELQGDGTSGLYRLSKRPVVVNSEHVRLQVRDRFHNETIISDTPLTRWTDYNIDFGGGSLFMRKPVPSHDPGFNPVYVVVDYEVGGGSAQSLSGGGRGQITLSQGKVVVGATAIHEGVAGNEGDLVAADLTVKLNDTTKVEVEVGSSEASTLTTSQEGAAYRAEVEHVGETLVGRAYLRQQDAGYGVGQQSAGESGTRKAGVEGTIEVTKQLDVNGQAYVQDNLQTGDERQVAEGALRYESEDHKYTATGGLRHATDDRSGGAFTSDQVFAGGTADVGAGVTLRAQTEVGVSGESANQAYPDRLTVGADYKMSDKATLFAEHEIAQGPADESQMTRVGVRTTPWERGRADASMEQQYSEYGPRLFATIGLGQGFQVTDALLLDFGLDRVTTIKGPSTPLYPNLPPPSGGVAGGDFTAYYAGATYRTGDWTMNGRVETLVGDVEDRSGISAGAYRAQGARMGLALRLSYLDSVLATGDTSTEATMSFGMAWRPTNPTILWLDRVDLVYDDAFTVFGGASRTHKLINNLNLNHRASARWETSYQYAFKWVRQEFGAEYTAYTDLLGIDTRYDLSSKWDFGGQLYALHAWESGTTDWSAGVSVGHSFAKNVWLSVGFNFAGFEDEDFAQARYTAAGAFIQFRIKFDQDSVKDLKSLATGTPVAPGAAGR
jgi:outer membrane protein OmpA-like peptidoglycan-associated protein